jgi:hypothetical protein
MKGKYSSEVAKLQTKWKYKRENEVDHKTLALANVAIHQLDTEQQELCEREIRQLISADVQWKKTESRYTLEVLMCSRERLVCAGKKELLCDSCTLVIVDDGHRKSARIDEIECRRVYKWNYKRERRGDSKTLAIANAAILELDMEEKEKCRREIDDLTHVELNRTTYGTDYIIRANICSSKSCSESKHRICDECSLTISETDARSYALVEIINCKIVYKWNYERIRIGNAKILTVLNFALSKLDEDEACLRDIDYIIEFRIDRLNDGTFYSAEVRMCNIPNLRSCPTTLCDLCHVVIFENVLETSSRVERIRCEKRHDWNYRFKRNSKPLIAVE